MSDYLIKSGDRAAFIDSLRELADFLTAHPDVLTPNCPSLGLVVLADDTTARRAGVEFAAAPLGAPVSDLGKGYYSASRYFGSLEFFIAAVPPKRLP